MGKRWKLEKPVAIVTSIALAFSLAVAPGVASARTSADGLVAATPVADNVPEWAIDDGADPQSGDLTTQAALPSTYDLRSEGLVTPVKLQNPWSSCWAFGGIAAAETSILSALGTTYEDSKLDLSERHLTYFALQPVTASVDPDQVGEGMHAVSSSGDPNAAFSSGGNPIFITTLFSQGVGPVVESLFPYRGVDAEGKSNYRGAEYFDADPEGVTRAQLASELGGEDKVDPFLAGQAAVLSEQIGREVGIDEVLVFFEGRVRDIYANGPAYSKYDDWSIPELNAAGAPNRLVSSGEVLKNGNVLPAYWNEDKTQVSAEGQNAIKQELMDGRGVTIMLYADQSDTYTMGDDENPLGKRYNQYISTPLSPDHGVCIVGWDDSYAAANFKGGAPGDGAWIVKNSWGSTAESCKDDLGNLVNNFNYGIKNDKGEYTGYFYLSYYDMTIGQPETMEFTSNLGTSGAFYTLQHDYLPAFGGFYTTPASNDVTSSANVFDADEDVVLKSVSTRTSEANMRVTFAVYLLKDGATSPTDGTLVYRTSRNFEYGGFHRLDLDQQIMVKAGQKFSVVSTVSTVEPNGKRSYSASANQGVSKAIAEHFGINSYSKAVVNEGESFLYRDSDKKWVDWSAYTKALPRDEGVPVGSSYVEQYPIDNFSIKAYAEPAEGPIDLSGASVAIGQATYNGGKAVKPSVTVKLAGGTLKEGSDYKVSYVNNKQTGSAVAIVKGKGLYTGAVVKSFTIAKAANTMTAKAKAKTNKVSWSKLNAKDQTISKAAAFKVGKAIGKVTFKKASGNKKVTVGKTGAITVKKGLSKDTYKVKVNVTAAGDDNHKPLTKTVTLKIKVS